MRNRIYFFTGTGNSLRAAQIIAEALPDCELVAIRKDTPLKIPNGLDRLGVVFPSYASGPPNMVAEFIQKMELPKQKDTYLFLAATYGGVVGSVLSLTGELLQMRGWKLHYGAAIRAYPNAVTLYPMVPGAGLLAGITSRHAKRVGKVIAAKRQNPVSDPDASARESHANYILSFEETDQGFHVNDDCISCGICKNVCPAENISMENGVPVFLHHCESCMACIQHCPKQAINYEDKTQKRGRYSHPDIGHQTITRYYRQGESH